MYYFAQTNIQLFNQAHELGYGAEPLALLRKAYELAIVLFTGRFRGSGKTFIAHLIGTASILTSQGAAPEVVAAGLLHAAYDSGDFGGREPGPSPAKRDYVRAAVGATVERYIASYSAWKWDDAAVRAVCDGLESLDPLEKEVLLIRLANELEDYLDLGILFCGVQKRQQAGYLSSRCRALCDIAQKLGYAELAAALSREFDKTEGASKERRFESPGARDFSFLAPPLSYKRVMDELARRLNRP